MNNREIVLSNVRAALGARQRSDRSSAAPRPPRRRVRNDADQLAELLAERVADYKATVQRCREDDVARWIETLLGPVGAIAVPRNFDWHVPRKVVADDLTAHELDAIPAVVSSVTVAIAETGTIILTHGPGQGPRKVSLVPDRLLCVVHEEQIVPDVPDALSVLDPRLPTTWISGPSATSDIELERVEGVHGPRELMVLIVQSTADD